MHDNLVDTFVNSALSVISEKGNYTKAHLKFCLKKQKIKESSFCNRKVVNCDPAQTKYYRFSGQCNNIKNPLWGAKETPLIRNFENGFQDGISQVPPNIATQSARDDSLTSNNAKGFNDTNFLELHNEMATMGFQLLTHEMLEKKKFNFLLPEGRVDSTVAIL